MWKQWTIAILGLIFIIAPFLGLTTFIFKATMAFGGLIFAILGFWALSEKKLPAKKESLLTGQAGTFGEKKEGETKRSDEF